MSGEVEQVPTEIVAGKYRLTRLLGRGGMGSVWEGVHTSLGTRVAVKFIESEYADSPDARNRFENEARAAATLKSKHVVQVYDHGVMPDGRPYIVMEFLAGEPLDSRLERVGRLSPVDATRIVMHVARALTKAHQAGIVHRDLKPENVFLVWDDEDHADVGKVVDFGIAKFTNADMGLSSSTRTGSVLGTPYFMSPEQARGLRSVDYRTDLWALGVIAYRCLVGSLPFTGEAVGDLLVKICTAPIPVPSQMAPDLPPAFDAWFAKALDRDPERRFTSALEMVEHLGACFGGRVAMGSYIDQDGGTNPQLAGTPNPAAFAFPTGPGMGGTHDHLVQSDAAVGARSADQTASPFNVTPPQGVPKKSNIGLVAVGLVGLLVLAGGGVGVAMTMGGQAAAPSEPTEVSAKMEVEEDAPEVAPIDTSAEQTEGEDDQVADEVEEEDDEEQTAADEAKPKPTATRPPAQPTAAPRPVTPRPRPARTATPRPRPPATPPPSDDPDVGY
jgi:serine/threonine-protein kinase